MASLESFLAMGHLIAAISGLIHALQRERGASNLFLGAGGAGFQEQLEGMVERTNAEAHVFLGAVNIDSKANRSEWDRSRLFSRIAHATHGLSELDNLRARVRSMGITPGQAVSGYSELVKGLLGIIFESADIAVDPALSRILVALFNFMEGKEFAGQERATGAGAFAGGVFKAEISARLLHLIDAQERSFGIFAEFADETTLRLWEDLQGSSRAADLERLRRIGCTATDSRPVGAALGESWFRVTTERIDAMKAIEDALEQKLGQICATRLDEVREMLERDRDRLNRSLEQGESESESSYVVFCGQEGGSALSAQSVSPKLGRSLVDIVREQSQRLQKMGEELLSAKAALNDRQTIEKAKGLLMKHRGVSENEAHKMLRDLAMKQGRRLPEVAESVISMENVWSAGSDPA